MRIVQLSDIHLSAENITDLRNFYIEGLVKDLQSFHTKKPIDVILITGDLVDKGGHSLGHKECYSIFEREFIEPIAKVLGLSKERFFLIPGNHDIDRNTIEKEFEYFLAHELTKDEANKLLETMRNRFEVRNNERIRHFKEFEREFHAATPNYVYSNNESLSTLFISGEKIGFALINDSWRCSSALQKEEHFIGSNQLFNAKVYFKEQGTQFNIAVFHHPLELINSDEAEEISNILKSFDFELAIFGHTHHVKLDNLISTNGGIIKVNGRAAFNNVKEGLSKFQPGYTIIDVSVKDQLCQIHGRKFILANYGFDKDVDNFQDGYMETRVVKSNNVPLYDEKTAPIKDLPSGFSTDVNRIVQLLIGKSLYPSSYSFVRELVQNAVDACNRRKEIETYAKPQIKINIDTKERYFEVIDEGDGMTKKVLREHFAVIGKSISQEQGHFGSEKALISQFGIGFISTFVVAERVIVNTKNINDERVQFEINDVFKGFVYNEVQTETSDEPGTTVRVYLKSKFRPEDCVAMAVECCRHIENLSVFVNGTKQELTGSWNTENATEIKRVSKLNYELQVAIGDSQRTFFASNSGFLIAKDQAPLLPYKFPAIIGGEVNFQPRAIDFDLSRSKVIETQKSREFKKELSLTLRPLFREALERGSAQLKNMVTGYLVHYLTYIDQEKNKFDETYQDFYTKSELINLLIDLLKFDYQGASLSLREIIYQLQQKGLDTAYLHTKDLTEDEKVIVRYLHGRGNFLFVPSSINIVFASVTHGNGNSAAVQKILQASDIKVIQLNKNNIAAIQLPHSSITTSASEVYHEIEHVQQVHSVRIRLVPLGSTERAVLQFGRGFVINTDSSAFKRLLASAPNMPAEMIFIYILGLLELDLVGYTAEADSTAVLEPSQ